MCGIFAYLNFLTPRSRWVLVVAGVTAVFQAVHH